MTARNDKLDEAWEEFRQRQIDFEKEKAEFEQQQRNLEDLKEECHSVLAMFKDAKRMTENASKKHQEFCELWERNFRRSLDLDRREQELAEREAEVEQRGQEVSRRERELDERNE